MQQTFQELISYLKNPVLEKDPNQDPKYRSKKFLHLLLISVITGMVCSPIFVLIESAGLVDMENHAMEKLLRDMPKIKVLFLAAVVAPLIEELVFRAPITVFKNKRLFNTAFYFLAILFGLVHLSNFTITNNVILLAPILVAPQIILGGYLGYIRVRFGLGWSILLHSAYNFIFILISFAGDLG